MSKQQAHKSTAQPEDISSRHATEAIEPAENAVAELADFQMEGDAVESFIKDKRIGLRIRALRQKNNMGLVDLGLHVGLSASFLSQLETGRVVPTLRNLARIAMVFSKDLSYFFDPGPRTLFKIHRQAERVRLPQSGVEDPMYFFESLGFLVPDRQMDPYLAEFQPKAGRASRAHQHLGSEFLYVLKGALCIQHGENANELRTGDSVYFDSSTTHSYSCVGDEPATALIVTLQQPLDSSSFRGAAQRSPEARHAAELRSMGAVATRSAATEKHTQSRRPH